LISLEVFSKGTNDISKILGILPKGTNLAEADKVSEGL
jgi:hypothetical protein